jgi:hypothetical protein
VFTLSCLRKLEEEKESGDGVLRPDRPVHRRLGTRDRRAHVHRPDEATGILRLFRRSRATQGEITSETQVEEVRTTGARTHRGSKQLPTRG